MKPKLPRGTLDRLWADPKNWNGGIYSCKEDPRIFIPKRIRWTGWAVNFAHARTWPILFGTILAIMAPMGWFVWEGAVNTPMYFTVMGVAVVLVTVVMCGVSWFFADSGRYEE